MHKSVLLQEVLTGLDLHPGEVLLDGTVGSGGHSEAVAKSFGKQVKIVGLDLDTGSLDRSRERLSQIGASFVLENESFRHLDLALKRLGIRSIDKILLDLGWSSDQFENGGRGFSFQHDEPLLMTYRTKPAETDLTAGDILNFWAEENLATIIKSYGEERFADRIARAIVEARKVKPIERTGELVEIIKSATPKGYHHLKIHPATKTFQALRIAVNDELRALSEGLEKSLLYLKSGGRLLVISFHSLEDRIVKNYFRDLARGGIVKLVVKKPIAPSYPEIKENPRARSAKLRIVEKI